MRNRTYVGRLERGGGWVDVHTDEGVSPLPCQPPPIEGAHWCEDRAATVSLAHAVLSDVFGAPASDGLAVTFAADVVAHLPEGEFTLGEQTIRRWRAGGPPNRMSGDELVEHLGAIALADEDDEHEALARLVETCWSGGAIHN